MVILQMICGMMCAMVIACGINILDKLITSRPLQEVSDMPFYIVKELEF